MPNWCECELRVSGPLELVTQLAEDVKSVNNPLSFERIVPMPQMLRGRDATSETGYECLFGARPHWLTAVVRSVRGESAKAPKSEHYLKLVQGELVGSYPSAAVQSLADALTVRLDRCASEEERKALIHAEERAAVRCKAVVDATGYTSWHPWSIDHWGTKWDACDCQVVGPLVKESRNKKVGQLTYYFNTAWSPPVPVVKVLIQTRKKLRFTLKYWEGGAAYRGILRGCKGEIVRDESWEYRGPRGG